jgi:hypothetical protein
MAAAPIVLTNAYVSINSVDLSTWTRSVKINYGAEVPETTAMGSSTKTRLPGLKDWSIDVELNQDFAAAATDVTLFSLVGASAFAIEVRPTTSSRSTTNPGFTGNALLADYPPLGNKVGDVATTTIKLTGTGTLTRSTS